MVMVLCFYFKCFVSNIVMLIIYKICFELISSELISSDFFFYFYRRFQKYYRYYLELRLEFEDDINCRIVVFENDIEVLERKFFLEDIVVDVVDECCDFLGKNLR